MTVGFHDVRVRVRACVSDNVSSTMIPPVKQVCGFSPHDTRLAAGQVVKEALNYT